MSDPTLDATVRFVHNQHYGQKDRAGDPYIFHVLRVALSFTTEPERTVALLHDLVEDTAITLAYLKDGMRYPAEIIAAVDCLTKRPDEEDDYPRYIQRVLAGPELARRVKLADLRDNANLRRLPAPTAADRKRARKYRAAIKLIRASLPSR